ncbi:MAG: carboxylating nicotinate-nucleotide diphosphorylase [Acidimicrobiales bacterium]
MKEVVRAALAEDIGPLGDLTASLLPAKAGGDAVVVPRTDGVLAGSAAAHEAFAQVDTRIAVAWTATDGDRVRAGDAVARVVGPLASILTAERTALNFLAHLSGIATLTRRYVDLADGRVAIRDTRKTTPGLRSLEKAAVRAGGGVNHRANLSDGILVKDNHLAGVSIAAAVATARRLWPGRTVQVECDDAGQLGQALAAGADLVLLDNMTPAQVRDCVDLVASEAAQSGRQRCLVEVSGGVTLATLDAYAGTGADLVAIGALTHSAPILDIGLDIVVIPAGAG